MDDDCFSVVDPFDSFGGMITVCDEDCNIFTGSFIEFAK